jgi:archaemetzincin
MDLARLVAVEIGALPAGLLEEVAPRVGASLGLDVSIARTMRDPAFAYDEHRQQFLALRLLEELRRLGHPGDRVAGAAAVDLFNPILTFVFGEAEMPGRASVFSIHRLRQEFYGLPADPHLLAERAVKEMLHEVGHTYGLAHCPDFNCTMSSSHSVEAVDLKGSNFCAACRRKMALARTAAPIQPRRGVSTGLTGPGSGFSEGPTGGPSNLSA